MRKIIYNTLYGRKHHEIHIKLMLMILVTLAHAWYHQGYDHYIPSVRPVVKKQQSDHQLLYPLLKEYLMALLVTLYYDYGHNYVSLIISRF